MSSSRLGSRLLSLSVFSLTLLLAPQARQVVPDPGSGGAPDLIRRSYGQAVPSCVERRGPFAWSCGGPIPGMACTQINEPADPHTWQDNFLCMPHDMGLRWSYAGPIPGIWPAPRSSSRPSRRTTAGRTTSCACRSARAGA